MPPLTSFQKSCLALAIGNLIVVPAEAASINVDAGCTLAQAITSANADSTPASTSCEPGMGDDTIFLPSLIDGLDDPLPAVESNITVQGTAANRTVVARGDVEVGFGIFDVQTDAHLTLINISVENGAAGEGGGIHVYYGSLTLDNSAVQENTASINGGGIFVYEGSFAATNSSVSNNNTSGSGGGIYARYPSSFSILSSTVDSNVAAIGGGGFKVYGQDPIPATPNPIVSIENSSISNNRSLNDNGGAAYILYATTQITSTDLTNNSALTGGGALYVKGSGSALTLSESSFTNNSVDSDVGKGGALCLGGTTADFSNTSFVANTAYEGGAILAYDGSSVNIVGGQLIDNEASVGGAINSTSGSLAIHTSTLSGNAAGTHGGAVFHSDGAFTLNISTISGNSANVDNGLGTGSALYLVGTGLKDISYSTIYQNPLVGGAANAASVHSDSAPIISNTVISGQANNDCYFNGAFATAEHNWFGDATCSGTADGIARLNPLAGNNLGSATTLTHAPKLSSPLLGAGLCNVPMALDQRGLKRAIPACDIGAVEIDQADCFVVKAKNGKVLSFCL